MLTVGQRVPYVPSPRVSAKRQRGPPVKVPPFSNQGLYSPDRKLSSQGELVVQFE